MFRQLRAWFSNDVPQEHKNFWNNNGGLTDKTPNSAYFMFISDPNSVQSYEQICTSNKNFEGISCINSLYIEACRAAGDLIEATNFVILRDEVEIECKVKYLENKASEEEKARVEEEKRQKRIEERRRREEIEKQLEIERLIKEDQLISKKKESEKKNKEIKLIIGNENCKVEDVDSFIESMDGAVFVEYNRGKKFMEYGDGDFNFEVFQDSNNNSDDQIIVDDDYNLNNIKNNNNNNNYNYNNNNNINNNINDNNNNNNNNKKRKELESNKPISIDELDENEIIKPNKNPISNNSPNTNKKKFSYDYDSDESTSKTIKSSTSNLGPKSSEHYIKSWGLDDDDKPSKPISSGIVKGAPNIKQKPIPPPKKRTDSDDESFDKNFVSPTKPSNYSKKEIDVKDSKSNNNKNKINNSNNNNSNISKPDLIISIDDD
ncbi:hypothetical protein DICPUDRAFT_146847 [Dictyostelium purpureum]|uniref:Uncharacterized protein n=1 Tax=Dictyostelium purpureum TaxID=5786 RepID=F0Z720_DICPU|nr:uncharacterized protein DICPUDRAFT_146847 [Dictyostelium purpureum]EGC40257.1 hypothetical protein DICPUDRAFT_146847 [Dictyostelium purpureum]|eukprot:XP_003283193.1 hypothetical protein DICPUDRAFT_146847 [Dictyostelium purpureum]